MAFQLLQNMASGHVKVQKGTGQVFYMATPSHTTESASYIDSKQGTQLHSSLKETIHRQYPVFFYTLWQKNNER